MDKKYLAFDKETLKFDRQKFKFEQKIASLESEIADLRKRKDGMTAADLMSSLRVQAEKVKEMHKKNKKTHKSKYYI